MLLVIGYVLVVTLLVTLASALLLGIGSALTYLFSVTVWEATMVVTAVAAGAFWLHFAIGPGAYADDLVEFPPEDSEEPPVIITNLPLRPSRRSRRRRR